ncbi:hypothetical protein [Streptomyces sp. ML-6]|uniref:hypothetical protein n=1 Tax=unclassified Streptomyces TaxID=2593676 RepID=UPI0024BF12D8|nr:hypothetical protein [Streptomyces sp. ML-6]MDK0524368.1 hypothetical protein [Streptomyces sp. ML-6]
MTPSAGRRSTPVPYAPLGGFLLLLVALFAVSYGVGRLAGPVAPDLRGVSHQDDAPGPHDMGNTDRTGGMDGMGH